MTKLCGIYVITHLETGRQYVGQSKHIYCMLAGKRGYCQGWKLASHPGKSRQNVGTYSFTHSDGREALATLAEMRAAYGADHHIGAVVSGKTKSCRGWSLTKQEEFA